MVLFSYLFQFINGENPYYWKFFKRKNSENSEANNQETQASNTHVNPNISITRTVESQSRKSPRIETCANYDVNSLERDPGLRPPIWDYPVDKRDEIRRAYIKAGPYQIILSKYPKSKEKHPRSFQSSWFKLFPSWLEYSPEKDAAFCLPYYLFRPQGGPSNLMHFQLMDFNHGRK